MSNAFEAAEPFLLKSPRFHPSVEPIEAIGEPTMSIRPTSGWRAINLAEVWRFRELAFFLAWRDVKVRYKQTVLGAAWAVIQPLMTMLVFTIFFGRLGGMSKYSTSNYEIFVFSALLPWTFFAGALAQCGSSLITNERLISKVYFPRLLIPMASLGTGLVDFAISFAVMALMMVYFQVGLTLNLLLLPVLICGLVIAALGSGMILASLAVVYRDFRHMIPFLVQIWMFASPVAYPLSIVPEKWRLVYSINPMAGLIGGFRSALLGEQIQSDCLAVSLLSAIILCTIGLSYFRRVERRFADII